MAELHFNWVDYFILAIVIISMVMGLVRGFVREIISVIIWIAALIIAVCFSDEVSHLLQPAIHAEHARLVVSFILLLILVFLVGLIVKFILEKTVEMGGLTFVNRLLGLVFGFIRGVVIVILLVVFLHLTEMIKSSAWQQSRLLPYTKSLVNLTEKLIPEHIVHYFGISEHYNNYKRSE